MWMSAARGTEAVTMAVTTPWEATTAPVTMVTRWWDATCAMVKKKSTLSPPHFTVLYILYGKNVVCLVLCGWSVSSVFAI